MKIGSNRKAPQPQGGKGGQPPSSQVHSFPAPVRGWITNENISKAGPAGATVLENIVPEEYSARVRGGLSKWATVHATNPCTSFIAYRYGGTAKLFATTAAEIYPITSPASPTVIPTADVSGLAGGDWSYVNFSTAGGNYLRAVNGTDASYTYDGTNWSTANTLTGGPGTNGDALNHIWSFKSRLFFIRKNSLSAYYLAVDAIAGALTELSLKGVFQRGGYLLFGATWSMDAGDGMDDMCVFVTDQGEIAVYQGTDPSSAATWALSGLYNMGRPMSKGAMMKAGGDLLIATDEGLIPISSAIKRDRAAITLDAVSRPIEPDWHTYTDERTGTWTVCKWTQKNYALIAFPLPTGEATECLIVNLKTGAWAKFTGWSVSCAIEFEGQLYVGTTDGKVGLAEATGQDMGSNYYWTYVGLFEDLGNPVTEKQALMMRGTFKHRSEINPAYSVMADYSVSLDSYPSSPVSTSTSVWDTALWDSGIWDADGSDRVTTEWVSVAGHGFTLAPVVQGTSGTVAAPNINIVSTDLLFTMGSTAV